MEDFRSMLSGALFQSTLPVWGATWALVIPTMPGVYFNPRSPCGERPKPLSPSSAHTKFQSTLPVWGATLCISGRRYVFVISIHAPRVGSDGQVDIFPVRIRNFNPRSPCGERPIPSRPAPPQKTYFNPRSPCGERLPARRRRTRGNYFNPRSPCGERLANPGSYYPWMGISIHAPRVGSDGLAAENGVVLNISIHAPRVGSDPQYLQKPPEAADFNPRSPCGERHIPTEVSVKVAVISIHAPRVGSDIDKPGFHLHGEISIHAPRVGSDYNDAVSAARDTQISIHAPRVGSDIQSRPARPQKFYFNPRSPCGERRGSG